MLRLPTVNEQARITRDDAASNDCLARPIAGSATIAIWAGGDEPEGWIDQSRRYGDLVRASGVACDQFVVPGTDHFTVLERSFEPDCAGWQAILRLLDDARAADREADESLP